MTVQISSTLLKPAVCLLVGASTVFCCSVAQAVTFNWSATIDSSNFGSGSFEATEVTGAGVSPGIYQVSGISGSSNKWTKAGIESTITGISSFYGANNRFYYTGASIFNPNANGVAFATDGGYDINLWSVAGGFNQNSSADYGAVDQISIGLDSAPSAIVDNIGSASVSEAVPGPLPILGLPAVLFYTRKLRNRIKASREASSVSLV